MIVKTENIVSAGFYFIIFSVLVPVLFFTIGSMMDSVLGNLLGNPHQIISFLGAVIIIVGFMIVTAAVSQLWFIGGGLPISSLHPDKFVKNGVYKFCRHPVYLGTALLFIGISLLTRSFWNLILTSPLFIAFFTVYAVNIEEPVLIKRFGKEYSEYRKTTPLLFPFQLPRSFKKWLINVLKLISLIVNRPFIINYKHHLFFLGYGIWCGLGIFFGLIVLNLLLLYLGAGKNDIRLLLAAVTAVCLLGARLIWILGTIVYLKKNIKVVLGQVGFVSWGALVGDLIGGVLFCFLTEISFLVWMDAVFFSQMLTHFFGRIGCLFYGCCYGKETCSDYSIRYEHPALKAVREGRINSGKIIPVQLFSSAYGLFIFILISAVWCFNELPVGIPFAVTAVFYAIFRFFEETYRYQKKIFFSLLSSAQVFCLILLLIGASSLFYLSVTHDNNYYQPLFSSLTPALLTGLEYPLLILLGLFSVFVFSYHRKEIGRWF